MKSKWKIDLEGFEGYVFGEDKQLYRLAHTDQSGKHRSLRMIKECKEKKRWWISRNGVIEKWSRTQLKTHLILDPNPIILTKENDLPF